MYLRECVDDMCLCPHRVRFGFCFPFDYYYIQCCYASESRYEFPSFKNNEKCKKAKKKATCTTHNERITVKKSEK